MRDFASCLGDRAVSVRETVGCGSGRTSPAPDRRLKDTVTSFHHATLSSGKELVIEVTWSRSGPDAPCSVAIEDRPPPPDGSSGPQLLTKKRGRRTFVTGGISVVSLHWDVSSAKYESSPVPARDFYVVAIADDELALMLGDMCGEFVRRLGWDVAPTAQSSVFGRRHRLHAAGDAIYTTVAQFRDGGRGHEVTIRCVGGGGGDGDEWGAGRGEVHVCVDGKRLVSVGSVRWNFRGNQMVSVDGAVVDVMWDVHGWWFCRPPRPARFVFRERRSLDSTLWLESELASDLSGFTLLIEAFNGGQCSSSKHF